MGRLGWIAALGLLAACNSDRVVSASQYPGGPITVAAGQEFALTLGTLGPGLYVSPPAISSSVVHFLSDSLVGPVTPAGPRQEFWFKAVTWGQATVTFRHTGDKPTIQAVVQVR
jgi:hypothetical protein